MLPCYKTPRLLLRPRSGEDFAPCLAMDQDPEVTRYIYGARGDAALLRARMERSYGPGLGYWSIFSKEEPQAFLGWILLLPLEGGTDVEIGWRLCRAAWGRGYASEAAAAILRHAFETVRLPRVVADIHPENRRSIRVAEKLGLVYAGDGTHKGGACRIYALDRADYLAGV